jgi:anti-sigma regulatory factor (Ser/Thr protein kinase)
MARITERTKKIQQQILRDVIHHPRDLVTHISSIFSISRQAVNRHVSTLVADGKLISEGATKNRIYALGPVREHNVLLEISKSVSEHDVFFNQFQNILSDMPSNISDIVFYGFTEMLNNVIDHSNGSECFVSVKRNVESIEIGIMDDGEGIFRKITRECNLIDEKQALLELHKGKLTTDPSNHSGQGIFFTSRMFDRFEIYSHQLKFSHDHELSLDILSDADYVKRDGTVVIMSISLSSKRIDKDIFDEYTVDKEVNDYAFNKTIIPVEMVKFGQENLVSRSQAKRLLMRVENFKYVYFDFKNVNSIGQAFADEIFRVYKIRHPDIHLFHTNTNEDVLGMIKRTESS